MTGMRDWRRLVPAAAVFGCALLVACRTIGSAAAPAPAGGLFYSASGEGQPALVFLHCWSCDRHLWDGTAAAMSARHRVVAIDLPGHGESVTIEPRGGWTITGLGEEVASRIAGLGLDRIVLVGSSMGAAVALDVAPRLPRQVVGVIVVDAVQNADFVFPEDQWQQLLHGLETDFRRSCGEFVAGLFGRQAASELIEARVADMCDADPAVALPLLRDLAARSEADLLRHTGVPVRGINGDLYPTDEAANRKYADYRATILAGSGHFPMLEKPAEFRAALERWLSDLSPAG